MINWQHDSYFRGIFSKISTLSNENIWCNAKNHLHSSILILYHCLCAATVFNLNLGSADNCFKQSSHSNHTKDTRLWCIWHWCRLSLGTWADAKDSVQDDGKPYMGTVASQQAHYDFSIEVVIKSKYGNASIEIKLMMEINLTHGRPTQESFRTLLAKSSSW